MELCFRKKKYCAMNKFPLIFTLSFLITVPFALLPAQEATQHEAIETEAEEVYHPHHALGIMISHANVREGVVDGNIRWLSLPSWGVNYNYHFSHRWAIGLHTDLINEEFKVERHLEGGDEGEVIDRNFPIAPALMATYKFGKRPHAEWGLEFGIGAEFGGGETFFLNRIGIEYAVEIRNHWEVFAGIAYDFRWGAYDTFAFGLGIAKAFRLPHEAHEAVEHH